jgi:ABC-type microcin C transport system permease subunit YejB
MAQRLWLSYQKGEFLNKIEQRLVVLGYSYDCQKYNIKLRNHLFRGSTMFVMARFPEGLQNESKLCVWLLTSS